MRDNLYLGDLQMKQRQGALLDEREHTRLANKAAGHQRFRHRAADALSRFRRRLATWNQRALQQPSPDSMPPARRRDVLG